MPADAPRTLITDPSGAPHFAPAAARAREEFTVRVMADRYEALYTEAGIEAVTRERPRYRSPVAGCGGSGSSASTRPRTPPCGSTIDCWDRMRDRATLSAPRP